MFQMFKNRKFTATGSGIAVVVIAGLLLHSTSGRAQQTGASTSTIDPVKALKGFQIAPVPLNEQGRDPLLV